MERSERVRARVYLTPPPILTLFLAHMHDAVLPWQKLVSSAIRLSIRQSPANTMGRPSPNVYGGGRGASKPAPYRPAQAGVSPRFAAVSLVRD